MALLNEPLRPVLKYDYRQPTYPCLQENLKKWMHIQVSIKHLIIDKYLITDEAWLSILKVLHTVATVMCDFLCSNSKLKRVQSAPHWILQSWVRLLSVDIYWLLLSLLSMALCCQCNHFRYNGTAHLIGLDSESVLIKISKPQIKLHLDCTVPS